MARKGEKDIALKNHFDLNNSLRHILMGIIDKLEKFSSLEENEKKEVFGLIKDITYRGNSYDSGTVSNIARVNGLSTSEVTDDSRYFVQMKTIFDNLSRENSELLEFVKKMISIIDEENKNINGYLNKSTIELNDRNKLIDDIKVKYHAEKQRLWGQVRLELGQFATYAEAEFNRTEETERQIVSRYINIYLALEKLVMNKDVKNDVRWDGIYRRLEELVELLYKISSNKYQKSFEGNLDKEIMTLGNKLNSYDKIDIEQLARNYFNMPDTFKAYFALHKKEFVDKVYSQLGEDAQKEIDKRLSEHLRLLYKDIKYVENKLKTDKEEGEDMEAEVKLFNAAVENLFTKLKEDGNRANLIHGIDPYLLQITVPSVGLMSIKDFIAAYVENKSEKNRKRTIVLVTQELNSSASNPDDYLKTQVRNPDFAAALSSLNPSGSGGSGSNDKIDNSDKDKIENIYHVITSITDFSALTPDDLNIIKSDMADLLTLLFGGNPANNIKSEGGSLVCKRFKAVCNSFNKKTHDVQISDVLSFAQANSNDLVALDFSKWKDFESKISFLF
ncbi:MAG: hypothetical protein KC550_00650 [Nanoarchaeota archaeon]|nr:hypothetical protein [Nanoarchaeota archaeon]